MGVRPLLTVSAAVLAAFSSQTIDRPAANAVAEPAVELIKVPGDGLQPEIAVDSRGAVHMVFLRGEPSAADVLYVRSTDGGKTFSNAVRVNSQSASAIATGTIRGAQIAIGRGGRVHVAWNGSDRALPKPPANPKTNRAGMPMLYARSNPARTAFEAQRNLMTSTFDLDGGGSIAADEQGRVYVAWHANTVEGNEGESARRVWIARSNDDGVTFSKEWPVSDASTGVCGCCALRLATTAVDALQLLYRSATNGVHRDVYALESTDRGSTFSGGRLHGWEIGACPMTSMSIAGARRVLRAWETDGQVYLDIGGSRERPVSPPGASSDSARRRKHPRVAENTDGTVFIAWTEGTSWARGGALAWQAFDRNGAPTAVRGTHAGVPPWSFVAVASRPDGRFVIFY